MSITDNGHLPLLGRLPWAPDPPLSRQGPRVRKALVSFATGPHRELLSLARPSFEYYAATHGYELLIADRCELAADRCAHWAKIPLLLEALSSHDIAVWLDADTMIVNFTRDIAGDLLEADFQGLVLEQLACRWNPNTGVWIIRSDSRSESFLAEVWDRGPLEGYIWPEQDAVMQALGWQLHPFPRGVRLVRPSHHLTGTGWLPPEWNWLVNQEDRRWQPRIKHWAGQFEPRLAAMKAEAEAQARFLAYAG